MGKIMRRRIVAVWISLIMLLSLIIIVVDLAPPARGAVITVDDSGGADYLTIQEGIDAANPGDTVFVYNGTYYENVVVNKTINLTGEDMGNTVIDGSYNSNDIWLKADWVNVSGFTLKRGGWQIDHAAIKIDSNHNLVFNNTLTTNEAFGLLVNYSSFNHIFDNYVSGNENGFRLLYSNNNLIYNNTMSYNDGGGSIRMSSNNTFYNNTITKCGSSFYVYDSYNNTISGNYIFDNEYGLHVSKCLNTSVTANNVFSNERSGIEVALSDNVTITNNNISNNDQYGLVLDSNMYNKVDNNTFFDSGIFIDGSQLKYWNTHNIGTSNTANGKPIYLLKNQTGGTVPLDAGQIILANCSNIKVDNLELDSVTVGIELGFCSNINISANTVRNSRHGIYIEYSDRIDISTNQLYNNIGGLRLGYSDSNNITANTASGNAAGITVSYSDLNNITDCIISNNEVGLGVFDSNWNEISGNEVINNDGQGIYISSSNDINITNNHVLNNYFGIWLSYSGGNNVTYNEVSGNEFGIAFFWASDNKVTGNNVSNNQNGLYFSQGNGNKVSSNNLSDNEYGLHLQSTIGNVITLNTMTDNGIFIRGSWIQYWNQNHIDTSNTINGKPVIYWKNQTTGVVPPGAGQVILANCTNITVANQNLTNGTVGIELGFSANINITSNNVSSNKVYGIYLYRSMQNNITLNNASNNNNGIYLMDSDENNIIGNNASNCGTGLYLYLSYDSSIMGNNASGNTNGIYLDGGSRNDIIGNIFSSNTQDGIYFQNSNGNSAHNNIASNNKRHGIIIAFSTGMNISGNSMVNNGIFIYAFWPLRDFNSHIIDTSNTVNGKPVYYWVNKTGGTIPPGAGQVILANCTNVNIENQDLSYGSVGVELAFSSNNNIFFNNVSFNNLYGIYLYQSQENNITGNNASSIGGNGIYLDESSHRNIINNNEASYNQETGIYLYESIGNIITQNTMIMDGIYIFGFSDEQWKTHTIDPSNTVNGKPVYYWKNQTGGTVPLGAGQIILANCTNVKIENQELTNGSVGIELFESSNINITYNNISSNNLFGLCSFISHENSIINNNFLLNKFCGLYVIFSDNNLIYHNNIVNNTVQAYIYSSDSSQLDNGYPSGGNYWSDYSGVDLNSTSTQDVPPPDGIGDTPYIIDSDSQDNYPLIVPVGEWVPPEDITPPVISSISVSDITDNSVTITWNTNEPSDSRVNWSVNSDLSDNMTAYSPTPTTSHIITITSLDSNRTYYFEVTSIDAYGNPATDSNSSQYYRFTSLFYDITKPTITDITALPPIQELHGNVNISAAVLDNNAVHGVWINISNPFNEYVGNFSMTYDIASNRFYYNSTFSEIGFYNFTIWAVDTSNNSAFSIGSLEIIEIPPVVIDTTPPTIINAQASPISQELNEFVNISALVTDNVDVGEVWIQILNPDSTELVNLTLFRIGSSDEFWYKRIFSALGDYTFIIRAKDTSDNWNQTEGSLKIRDTTAPITDAGTGLEISQGETAAFDGSSSSDNDDIINYSWSFDYDGRTIILYGMNPSFQFITIENYTIILTATDPSGNSASDSIWINVVGVDSDDDRLTDWDEVNIYKTKPDNPDTDDDGVNDGDEIDRGTSPLVPDKGKEPEKSFIDNYLWIFLILAIIIIVLLFFVLSRRKENEIIGEEEDIDKEPSGIEITDEDEETIPDTLTSSEITEPVVDPVSETLAQPAKRKPPRPPRAPRSQA
jgi:parallel beta-helix repeat protein